MEKDKEDKFTLRQFKDKSSNWFLNNKHYRLNEQGLIVFIAGGKEDEEEIKYLEEFCKRNKKKFTPRSASIFEQEEKEYFTITFGKHFGKSTINILNEDKKWLSWMYKNYSFKLGEEKLKQEIKELLKIK